MIRSEEIDLREGLVYDVAIKGNDANFWKTDTGALSISSLKLRFNASTASSYAQFLYGDFDFFLAVPTPGAGSSRKWGLVNAGDSDERGSVYFQMDTEFYAVIKSETGVKQRTAITFDSDNWDSALTHYRIRWEDDGVQFLVNDTVYVTMPIVKNSVTTSTGQINTSIPQALRIVNNDANNVDLAHLLVRHSRKVI